jgi:hypothetical protein
MKIMDDTEKTKKEIKKSKALARNTLFKKKKALFKDYYDTADFKEPILILMRKTQNAEFFENATKGDFEYDHSDGTTRRIFLNTKYIQTFPYGKKVFKGYICHEDNPLPLPAEPEITAETVGLAIDKTLNDIKKWKADEFRAKGEFYWKIALGIVAIGAMYILYKLVIVPSPDPIVAPIAQIVKNTSVEVLNATIFR